MNDDEPVLFEVPATLEDRLVAIYAEALLQSPPVLSLAHDLPEGRRKAEARRLALKDIRRLLAACERFGYRLELVGIEEGK
jgi:hypothetical protein